MKEISLIGTWRLISFKSRTVDGQVTDPWGKNTVGYIMYNEDGYMSVSVMSANRSKFISGDMKGGTVEEKAAAAGTYISYCGKYEIQGDAIIHHIELSLFPNWVAVGQKRIFKLEDNKLSLSTSPALVDGVEQTFRLVWERV